MRSMFFVLAVTTMSCATNEPNVQKPVAAPTVAASSVSSSPVAAAPTGKKFKIYRGETLELDVTDTPGPLVSTSAPPPVPGSPPPKPHPFLSASAYVAADEGALRALLDESHSTAEFLDKLRARGYRVVEVP
ncbi:MAG: hypothetical protein ACXWUG_28370 [Polyangiales bacterium]